MSKVSHEKLNKPTNPFSNFIGATAVSTAFHPLVFFTYDLMVRKQGSINNVGYPNIIREILNGSLRGFSLDATRMLLGRIKGPVAIASIGNPLFQHAGIPSSGFAVAAGLGEAAIFGPAEIAHRFNSSSRLHFPQIPGGTDLTKITKLAFDSFTDTYSKEHPNKKPGTFDYLEQRRLILRGNMGFQYGFLAARNLVFQTAVYATKPMAIDLVDQYGGMFDKFGIGRDAQIEILTIMNRLSLACLTTPLDTILTGVSSGNQPAMEFLKAADLKSLFRGAMARSLLVFLAATTIAEGLKLGEYIHDFAKDDPLLQLTVGSVSKVLTGVKGGGLVSAKDKPDLQTVSDVDFLSTLKDYDDVMLEDGYLEKVLGSHLGKETSRQVMENIESQSENLAENLAEQIDQKISPKKKSTFVPKMPVGSDFRFLSRLQQVTPGCGEMHEAFLQSAANYRSKVAPPAKVIAPRESESLKPDFTREK
jgi:hypothetical protein